MTRLKKYNLEKRAKRLLNELDDAYASELKRIKEYCDENCKYSRGEDYDFMVSNLNDWYSKEYQAITD